MGIRKSIVNVLFMVLLLVVIWLCLLARTSWCVAVCWAAQRTELAAAPRPQVLGFCVVEQQCSLGYASSHAFGRLLVTVHHAGAGAAAAAAPQPVANTGQQHGAATHCVRAGR